MRIFRQSLRFMCLPILKLRKPAFLLGMTMCGIHMTKVYSDTHQCTVVTDNHPTCAVLVLKISEHKAFNAVLGKLKQIPKLCVQKSNVDDELDPLMVGIGFSTELWEKLKNEPQPAYEARVSKYGPMVAGQGNVIIHIKAENYSLAYETVQQILEALPNNSYQIISERYGFKYQDGRDLSGFIDGTMNPSVLPQRINAAVNEKGGSYLIHQVWHHDLDYLKTLPIDQQEQMIGRTKEKSIELRPLPTNSHVARMRDLNNQRLLIVRQSMPFGSVTGEHGLLFLAYAKDGKNFNAMLDRMVGKGDTGQDEIMRMSRNTFGNYFYIPSLEELQRL